MSCGVALAGQVRVRVLTALILLAFIACGLCSSTCECDTPQLRAALIRFFYATGGVGWYNASGWASYDPVCSWYGIRCHGAELTDIILSDNLTGTLPAELANITSIQRIELAANNLYGPLPREWSKMSQIRVLNLYSNRINGTLPPEWSAMQKLEQLDLESNRIAGSLPPDWGKMSRIQALLLGSNRINGTMPPEWSAMPMLERLQLTDNQINGLLPPEWGKMTQIRDIRLYRNNLTGPLPYEWSNMTQLKTLYLQQNSLSGPLAPCLFPRWNASFMGGRDFDFSNNKFSGRLRLPCLSIDPCYDEYRYRLNDLLLRGNQVCGVCNIECQCNKTENTAIESPNLAIVRASNSSECCSACSKHPLCVAAVYHHGYNRCELKNVTSPTFAMPNADVLVTL